MCNLLQGLPDDLVVEEILPRLPWYTRPVCRAASKPWKATMDTAAEDIELQITTQRHQLPLLTDSTVIFSRNVDKEMDIMMERGEPLLFIKDLEGIRQLPPVRFFEGRARLVFWNGMIYAWTLAGRKCWSGERNRIFKLDLGRGKWKWQSFPVDYISAWFDEVCHKGNIYAAWKSRHKTYGVGSVRLNVHVYDMDTDTFRKIEKWPYSCVGVSWDSLEQGSEKVAGFDEDTENRWNLLTYDGGSWVRQAVIQSEECFIDIKFVRGDCFVPALEGFSLVSLGRNYTEESIYIIWYNTRYSQEWLTIDNVESVFTGNVELTRLEVVNGQLCALCKQSKTETRGERWYIYHGKIDRQLTNKLWWEVFMEMETPIECWAPMRIRK